jgi:hypothetical protein
MMQDDLDTLAKAPLDRSLDSLESDIWRGVESRLVERRAYAGAFAVQMVILTLGTLGSLAAGHRWAAAHEATTAGVFSPYTPLAASTLLMGEPR